MPPETDNQRIEELYLADQKDRQRVYDSAAGVKELQQRDAMRRALLCDMIAKDQVKTPNDLYHAAVMFLHGAEPKDFMTAHRLASIAAINGHPQSRWVMAASLDRFLMSVSLPQLYGTQFQHNAKENKYEPRLPLDDRNLLGFEKRFFNVPPVEDRLAQLNKRVQEEQ